MPFFLLLTCYTFALSDNAMLEESIPSLLDNFNIPWPSAIP